MLHRPTEGNYSTLKDVKNLYNLKKTHFIFREDKHDDVNFL